MNLLIIRLVKILDALSQLAQVAVCPRIKDTTANESVSGRSYREGWWVRHPINWVFFWQKDHCKMSYLKDYERAKEYLEMRVNK